MEALKSACAFQQFKSFRELERGEYIITRFTKVKTTVGEGDRIRVDCDGFYLILPERFAKTLTDKAIRELNTSPKVMVYQGKDIMNRNRLILDFKEATTYLTGVLDETVQLNPEFYT